LTYPGTVTDELGATGAQTLYGVTGDGTNSNGGKVQIYLLGQLELTSTGTLESVPSTTPPPPVPVPAALWLFGSGLLGLAGVGRRKAA
jgi:hypothetical protein